MLRIIIPSRSDPTVGARCAMCMHRVRHRSHKGTCLSAGIRRILHRTTDVHIWQKPCVSTIFCWPFLARLVRLREHPFDWTISPIQSGIDWILATNRRCTTSTSHDESIIYLVFSLPVDWFVKEFVEWSATLHSTFERFCTHGNIILLFFFLSLQFFCCWVVVAYHSQVRLHFGLSHSRTEFIIVFYFFPKLKSKLQRARAYRKTSHTKIPMWNVKHCANKFRRTYSGVRIKIPFTWNAERIL